MKGSMRLRGETWQLRASLPADGTGKRRFMTVTFAGTKREAQVRLAKLVAEAADRTAPFLDQRTKLGDFLERYVAARTNVRESSREAHARVVRAIIRPRLGDLRVARLSSLDLDALYADLGREGYSASYVLLVHQVIASALRGAVRAGLLARAVTDMASPPKHVPATDRTLPTKDALQRVLAASSPGLRVALLVLVGTGIRRGELCGLTWDRIDLERGMVRIDRQAVAAGGTVKLTPPKSRSGERTLMLPAGLIEPLRAWRRTQREERLRTGQRPELDLVFPGRGGAIRKPDSFTNSVRAAGERAGVRFHPHLLRHVHVSELLHAGVPLSVVKDRVGHASIATTVDVYAHLIESAEAQAAAAADGLVAKLATELATN